MKKRVKNRDEKYVMESTFEKHMTNIAKSFARVDESFDRINKTLITHEEVMQHILKELKQIHEDHKDFRQSITNLYSENLSRDKMLDGLTVRVGKLELKSK